jgi:hypothetical protein
MSNKVFRRVIVCSPPTFNAMISFGGEDTEVKPNFRSIFRKGLTSDGNKGGSKTGESPFSNVCN